MDRAVLAKKLREIIEDRTENGDPWYRACSGKRLFRGKEVAGEIY
jgi:hypothetical protein